MIIQNVNESMKYSLLNRDFLHLFFVGGGGEEYFWTIPVAIVTSS